MFQLLKTFSDPNSRFIIIDIKTESKALTLVNIYAPNNDDPSFFKSVLKMLLPECVECAWGGEKRKTKCHRKTITRGKKL